MVKYTIKDEELYTYSGHVKLNFDSEITLDSDENVTRILAGEEEIELFTEPIYYEGKKQVLWELWATHLVDRGR